MKYLTNPDHRLRYRAAIALANLQDTSAVRYLIPLLMDENTSVRQGAAFALGQIGSREAQKNLLGVLKNEKEKSVISRILEALGRCGGQTGLEEIVEYTTSDSSVKREQALSVARFALRNLKSERSIWFCFDLIDDRDPEVQWRALYALWRLTPHGLIDTEISKRKDTLRTLAHSSSADVRMHLATLLGRSKSTDALDLLKEHQKVEATKSEWRVQVQLVRAFGSFGAKDSELLETVVGYLDSGNNHVSIAALQTIASLPKEVARSSPMNEILRQKLLKLCVTRNEVAQVLQGEALVATGRHFPDELLKRVSIVSDEGTSPLVRAKFLEGLSLNASGKSLEVFIDKLNDQTSRVSMAAWDFVKRLFSPTSVVTLKDQYANWSKIGEIMSEKIDSSLSRRDMGVSTLVANAVADSSFFSIMQSTGYAEKAVGQLMNSYSNFSTPDDLEAMQAILGAFGAIKAKSAVPLLEKTLNDPDRTVADEAVMALRRITGRDYSARIPRSTKPVYSDYDWELLESLSPTQTVLVKTSKGLIRLELLKEHAPFTVSSFVKLMKKRFFDGLNFHRVVPNFVVQGGDPRGDGWGGPGYALRSEYSLLNYQRGSVGVASAGKDTEGCQFFITHSPQPHLDGRYTIFARVVSGMEVVDKLQVGDKMLQMDLRD